MSRYADDLKRLVGIEALQADLETQIAKAALGGNRGVAWLDPTTGNVNSASGSTDSGITAPLDAVGSGIAGAVSGATTAALNAVAGAASADSAGSALSALATTITAGTDGVVAIQSLLSGADQAVIGIGTGNALKGFTGAADIASGRAVTVYEDGQFRPPSDRISPNTDAIDTTWISGQQWTSQAPGASTYASPAEAATAYVAYYNSVSGLTGESCAQTSLIGPTIVSGIYTYELVVEFTVISTGDPAGSSSSTITGNSCTPGSAGNCTLAPPTIYNWPSQSSTQLAQNADGQFTANARDTGVPLGFVVPSSTLILSSGGGNYVTQRPTISGGFIVGQSDVNGNFTGLVHVFTAQGVQTGIVSATEGAAYAMPF